MRIVVKVGTNTLAGSDGLPDLDWMAQLGRQIAAWRTEGHEILLVSSGAIGCGRAVLGKSGPLDVPARQACAAVGQRKLMDAWGDAITGPTAQILLTADTFNERRSYVNLQNCIHALLREGVVPVINENDVISTQEIDATFTDNDQLGALVAAKIEADLYVVLTDVEGLLSHAPGHPDAVLIPKVGVVDAAILAIAAGASKHGRGGMQSKVVAAKFLAQAGVPSVITHGRRELSGLLGETPPGTWFAATGKQDGKLRWLQAAAAQGTVHLDDGAAAALASGAQLLPAGVTGVDGWFPVESVVSLSSGGQELAKAVTRLSSDDLRRCLGMQSKQARQILGIEGSVNVTRKGLVKLDKALSSAPS